MDEKSFGNKAAYVDSISDAAQSDGMSEVIYEDERWKVVLIGSTIAGQWWGRDTDFCISSLKDNLYSSYAKVGNIDPYFIIDKLANSSDKMRKFTIAIKYKEDESFEISKDSHTMTDATNVGISMEDIERRLGESYEKILGEIKKNAGSRKQSAGKENGKKLKEIIRSKDVIGIKKYEKEIKEIAADEDLSKEFLHNLNHIKNFENMRNLIINIINKNPYNLLKRLSGEDWTKEERPELNGISYIDIARMGYAKQSPTDFITNFSMEEWAMEKRAELGGKSCLDIAAEASARTNPIYFLDYFSKKPWAKDYISGAAEVYANQSPIDFLESFSEKTWAKEKRSELEGKSYVDLANEALNAKNLNQTASQASVKLLKLAGAIKKMSTGNISQEIVELKKLASKIY